MRKIDNVIEEGRKMSETSSNSPARLVTRSQFWIAAVLTVAVASVGYLPDILYAAGIQIPQLLIDFVARDINLLLIPIPVFYAAYVFKTRGVVLVAVAILAGLAFVIRPIRRRRAPAETPEQ